MNEQDKRVRDFYNHFTLPQDKLEQLLKLAPAADSSTPAEGALPTDYSNYSAQVQEAVTPSVKNTVFSRAGLLRFNPTHWRMNYWLSSGIACAFMLMLTVWVYGTNTNSERTQRTVREVAMNHATRLEPEYRGDSLAKLDNSMQQLPFALTLPEKAIDSAYELVGSRYCSLGGVLSAHVRFKSTESGKPVSLFVTSNSDELKDIHSQQTSLDGIDVEFWREGGLFFALAQRS